MREETNKVSPGISPACCLETVSRLQRRRVELLRMELGAPRSEEVELGDPRQGCYRPGGRALGAESCAQRALGTSESQNLPVGKLTKARERSAWKSRVRNPRPSQRVGSSPTPERRPSTCTGHWEADSALVSAVEMLTLS